MLPFLINLYLFQVYKKILRLKNINVSLKVLLSVGEMSDSSTTGGFRTVVSSEEARKK
jgi:hypothetical protein